jgi:hypothetical protein
MSSQGTRSDAVRMGTPAPGGLPLVDRFDERDLSIWRRWREPISKRGGWSSWSRMRLSTCRCTGR